MPTQKTPQLSWLTKEIQMLKDNGLFIAIRTIDSPTDRVITVNGKKCLNFCTNNYLGLANDPRLKKAAIASLTKYGVGPTAVRTIAGTTSLHLALERKLAKFKKVEDVITFQSGFNANIATIPALVGEGDIILSDELNHASIIDGCRLSRAEVVRFAHKDMTDLANKLAKVKGSVKKLIITDGVFSMDGDIAPLPHIARLAKKYKAMSMVDDAHGEGVLGKSGRGIVDHFNLHGQIDIEVGTLSKAIGVVGGMVAGKKVIIDWLRQRARPFLFSSAMTPADAGACLEAISILSTSSKLVNKLWQNTYHFKNVLTDLGFDTGKSETPIIPIMLGDVQLAKNFSAELFANGLFAMAIGYPTVPLGLARIRVMLSASHTPDDLTKALAIFKKVGIKLQVI